MAGLAAVLILGVFLGGVALGVMALAAGAVRREDRRFSLAGEAARARRLTSVSGLAPRPGSGADR